MFTFSQAHDSCFDGRPVRRSSAGLPLVVAAVLELELVAATIVP